MLSLHRSDARLTSWLGAVANNGTSTKFGNPFSPHQIGTYPIADATTASQEPMPMENTGNMFLMLAGIVQRTPGASHDWLMPYMPMLTNWAEYLISTLPYPAEQLCTDDFTGKLANNTNLAAKGIVALEAFSHLCTASGGSGCARYSDAATGFVKTWIQEGLEQKPAPHYKIAYNFPNSYSIKYAPHFSCSSHLSDREICWPEQVQRGLAEAAQLHQAVPMEASGQGDGGAV